MVKQDNTTKSTKRYTYSSFRDRVDAIKIEPTKRLNTRAYDDAETSHFLATLERWIEFNRSASFTELADKVEPISQSLPQLLHYKQRIFEELAAAISKHDDLSLQPLLELLTQFCHDLGPDFLEFYEPTVKLIMDLALAENTADALEWEFNCLAFIFKYLSKFLSQDLVPTFELLLPLFNSKDHVARFSAESLSFLLRKTAQQNLVNFTTFAFEKVGAESYNKALSILFSEAMKSTQGAIHSKSHIIIRSLLESLESDDVTSILGDILINVINYGTPESVKEIYELVISIISSKVKNDNDYLPHYIKLLTVLIFADSGMKVPDWSVIVDCLTYIIDNVDLTKTTTHTKQLTTYLFAIFVRNCDLQKFTTFHSSLFQYALTLGPLFLPFVTIILDLSKERALKYSRPYVQEFVNKQWKENGEVIACFIDDLTHKELITQKDDMTKLRVLVPSLFVESICADLDKIVIDSESLYEVYWRLLVLTHSSSTNTETLLRLLTIIRDFESQDEFRITILAQLVALVSTSSFETKSQVLFENFELLYKSPVYLASVTKFVKAEKFTPENVQDLVSVLSNNLISPSHIIRHETLQLISALTLKHNDAIYNIANQCDIIEQVPLVLNNSRDIQRRLRSFAADFKNLEVTDTLPSQVYFKFLFGLLSVHFSPTWKGVYESLPETYQKNKELIWDLAYGFITGSHELEPAPFYVDMSDEIAEDLVEWSIIDTRLYSVINHAGDLIEKYQSEKKSLLDSAERHNTVEAYPSYICAHALEALKSVPEVGELHSVELVSLVVDEDSAERPMTKKEQLSLMELFVKFKKLKSISRSGEFYSKLLFLLSNKSSELRKVTLDCLLNYKNKSVTKYKDNLINLLDDSMFRDEIQRITSKGEDRVLEAEDEKDVMPLILRVIFGRAQSVTNSGNKKGMKLGALSVLPNLSPEHITQFLDMVSEKVYVSSNEDDNEWVAPEIVGVTNDTLKRCLGYTNLLAELINTLGEKFKHLLSHTLRPLIVSLLTAEEVLQGDHDDVQLVSTARNVRQSGTKDLYMLFNILDDFNWDAYIVTIYEKVLAPRFIHFEDENLQQPSALLKILICWSERKNYVELLMINDLEPSHKVLSLLQNSLTKNEVLSVVLDFCTNIITKASKKSKFQNLHKLVAEKVLSSLESILARVTDYQINNKTINLLLSLVENGHVEIQEKRAKLVTLCTQLLEKPNAQMSKDLKLQVLKILKALIEEFDGEFDDIKHLYEVSSRFLKFFTDRQQREVLIELFVDIGSKFEDYARVGRYLTDLNSYSKRGLAELDYDTRLGAFREINEKTFSELTALEWVPLLNTVLFFLTDVDDLAIRTNASFTIRKFVDSFSTKDEADKAFIRIFKDLILSNLRVGLRSKNSAVKGEFIAILSHIVTSVKYVDDFKDMSVLLFNNDEESNFFMNINHIQVHRRQRTIKRLGQVASQLSGASISHYILPMIENYAYVTDEALRNVANETVLTIEELIRCISYRQYLAIFRRYMAGLKEGSTTLRDSVSLVVTISKALMKNVQSGVDMEGLPKDKSIFDSQLEKDLIGPIAAILNKRDDETIVHRTPLIESLACLILCLSHDRIVVVLPGVLTKICQILRSRSDELRDAVRKHLGRASKTLGSRYIRFIIKELKTALARGFQVHVLGFTVHSIISEMEFAHGELDDSASLIMDVAMENTFGSTGQEKEADGYRTTMKEVKNNKSYDLVELLARVISISQFNDVVNPIKLLLLERITLKIQNKLDEMLRRISQGIYKNEESTKQEMLMLAYELSKESERDFTKEYKEKPQSESEKHFLVQLNAKKQRVVSENSVYVDTFQRFSLELLRSALNKNAEFITGENLVGFLPFIEKALLSENESVVIAALRILMMIMHVEFTVEGDIFKRAARRALNIVKDFPSTESELCQFSYKYLSSVIRERKDLALKDTSLGYLLVRIQPDLSEENRQGMAFNFLRALVTKHVVIPEVYDTMDKIREVMVTSHSKERRDMSRSIYFKFLMEYDQGRGRLEKQFKFLVDNLSYPAESGKQSVMELLHLIIQKAGPELLNAVSSSFFVALSKVLISETSTKSRDMAISLITDIFKHNGTDEFEKFIRGWMNSKNSALLKCSLQLYRIKLKVSGMKSESDLDDDVLVNIKEILSNSRSNSEIEVKWDLLYIALMCLHVVVDKKVEVIDDELKSDIISCLLFPHSWIRLAAGRIVGTLVANKKETLTDTDLQNIGYRLFHQLGAPAIDEELGTQNVKTLTALMMHWESNNVEFDESLRNKDESDDDEEQAPSEARKMADWAISRAGSVVRSERTCFQAKKAGIQFLALSVQILGEDRVDSIAQDLILPLFVLGELDTDDDEKTELQNLALECLKLIENKIGVSNYTSHYSKVGQFVIKRRQERRTKRARLAITAPESAARRKVKKHERTREKRKHEKDDSGFYHTKKKKTHRR